MADPLNLLIIEDSDSDTDLIVRAVRKAGYDVGYTQAQDPNSVKAALAQQTWDAVLCDYAMPRLDAHAALELLRESGLDTPFIILSGAIREELAVTLIKAGAHDFVSKSNLIRLGSVLEREINQANLRRAHRLAIHAREKNENRFRAIIESSPVPLAVNDDHGNITYLNPKFVQTFGYTIHDIPSLADWWPLAYPDEAYRAWVIATWRQAVEKANREGKEVAPIELNIACKDGTQRTVLAHPTPMDDAHLVYLYDITASKRISETLRNERLRLASILHSAVDAIVLIDAKGTILSFNPAAENIFYISEKEAIGKNVKSLMPSLHAEQHDNYLERFIQTGQAKIIGKGREVTGLRGNGEQFPMELSVSSWADGEQLFFTGVVRDITKQKAVQAQLMQTQKMESLTHLAGGLAHDFNNLLGIVIGNLDILEARLQGDDKSVAKVQTALRAALRGVDITRRMLTLSHLQNRKSESDRLHDINALIDEIVAILRGTLGPQYTIFTALLPDLPRVKLDPSEFENVLLNLALNARDAMPNGGQIVILTRQIPRENLLLPNLLDSDSAKSYVLLEFSDTGHGMSEDVRERALDPFFTTKTGKGTGLGLAMAYSFAKDRKGHIQILSDVGAGTAVHIYLPASDDAFSPTAITAADTADLPGGTETILAVDDEQDLLALTTSYLQSLGYHVIFANNALDALALLNTEPAISLLLTDVVMPGGILGTELAVKAQQLRPELPVILCSGFPKKVQDDAQYAKFAHDILPKPYRKTELAHAVRHKLDARNRSPGSLPRMAQGTSLSMRKGIKR